jgi:O-acetyl-ADP-ribose deacetylase (regulator of RNase III)
MITYVVSDLFQSPAKVLVNTVNTVGVMGKGIAEAFKLYYPDMFAQYETLCNQGQFTVGQLWLYRTPHKWVLNFPTKAHWRDPSRIEYVEDGLRKFAATYADKGIASASFPLLGCGAGGLDWPTQVRPLMERYLAPLPMNAYIHLYESDNPFAPETRDTEAIRIWLNGEPQAPTFDNFWNDLITAIRRQNRLKTLDTAQEFEVALDLEERHLSIQSSGAASIELGKNLLSELWQYIRAAGFCLPQHFPGGLDVHAPYIVALLTRLDYLRPVYVSTNTDQRQIGLQLIAPLAVSEDVAKVIA